jgi:hypothetical protein
VADVMEMNMNPIDEVLTHPHMQKQATQFNLPGMGGFGNAARSFWQGARSAVNPATMGVEAAKGVAGAAAGALALAAVPAAKKIWDSIESRRVFKEMVQLNPGLAQAQQENPMVFNAAYNSLRRLNPVYAGDPMVAGALLERMMSPDADASSRMRALTEGIKQPNAPQHSVMLGTKLGPFQFAHSI